MDSKVGLILLGCVLACSGRSVFNDICTLKLNPGPSAGTTMDVDANKDCQKGAVWWSGPQGNLTVHFKQNNPSALFKLCMIEEGSFLYFINAYDVETGQVVAKPSKESDSCVNSTNGEVTLNFEAGIGMYYMALIHFEIRQI